MAIESYRESAAAGKVRRVLLTGADRLIEPKVAEGDPLPHDDVVRRAQAEPIETVYRRTRPRLLRFLARRSSSCEAEDLAQQTFVRYLVHHEKAAPIDRPDSYLFRVARNLAIDDFKSAQRHSRAAHLALDDVELTAPDQLAALEARDMLNRLEANVRRDTRRERFPRRSADAAGDGQEPAC